MPFGFPLRDTLAGNVNSNSLKSSIIASARNYGTNINPRDTSNFDAQNVRILKQSKRPTLRSKFFLAKFPSCTRTLSASEYKTIFDLFLFKIC